MGYPYYKRFPRDFFEGTIGMSFEVKGAYGLLIDLIFIRDGRLPDDARFIAGHLGLSVRKWNAIRAELIAAGKISVDLGIISNLRADNLTIERRLSPDKKEINRVEANENNNLQEPRAGGRARASEPEPEDSGGGDISAREPIDDWPAGSSADHADALCDLAATVNLDRSREGGLTLTAGRLHAWRRDGASWERDVKPVVLTLAAKARGPITSWKYFDRAVAEAKANNERELERIDHDATDHPGRTTTGFAKAGTDRRGPASMAGVLARQRGLG